MANSIDKNQAVIDFLITCPYIRNSPLYFNLINASDNSKQLITSSNDKATSVSYIDGSILKTYTFTLIDFKSVTFDPIIQIEGYSNENVDDMASVQEIVDWVNTQADNKNYPYFGEDCVIEEMQVMSENPSLNFIDTTISPALAKYSISIRIDYLDKSKMIWK